MDLMAIRQALSLGKIVWQKHALSRMLERGISRQMAFTCLEEGNIIEEYGQDRPFPSVLVLGFPGGEPLHLVAAYDEAAATVYIVTVYRPDEKHFGADYKTRRSS